MMDKNKTGTIDWWEFINHEALKVIGKNRSKVSPFNEAETNRGTRFKPPTYDHLLLFLEL